MRFTFIYVTLFTLLSCIQSMYALPYSRLLSISNNVDRSNTNIIDSSNDSSTLHSIAHITTNQNTALLGWVIAYVIDTNTFIYC